jgi:hypothetical protein
VNAIRSLIVGTVFLGLVVLPAATAKPVEEKVSIELNLEGFALQTNTGTTFSATLNVTGEGTRTTPNGNGVQIRADKLVAHLVILDSEDDEVANYSAFVKFHAQQASSLAQGLPVGNFKFTLQITGKRSDAMISNNDTDDRVLSMNSKGSTSGAGDDDGFFAVQGSGQSTSQPEGRGSGARHFNMEWGGQGRIATAT